MSDFYQVRPPRKLVLSARPLYAKSHEVRPLRHTESAIDVPYLGHTVGSTIVRVCPSRPNANWIASFDETLRGRECSRRGLSIQCNRQYSADDNSRGRGATEKLQAQKSENTLPMRPRLEQV